MNLITVDLGGTNTRVAYAANLNKPSFASTPFRRKNTYTYDDDLAFIINAAKELSGNKPIDALGIGVPGRVNDDKTDMVASYNLPEWANTNFARDLAEALNCPVYMDNDAVAASLGEAYYGDTKGNFHYLIWGTGISGVSVEHKNGAVVATYIRPNYKQLFDPWEESCGGAAILRKHNKPGEELTSSEWQEINAAFAEYLRQYIAMAKPSAIVFGGGLAVRHSETISKHAADMGIPIAVTQFGDDCGLIGGLGLVQRGIVSADPGA